MFLKPEFFFLRKQRYNTVRNGSRARIIYTSGSVELRVSNPLIAWTTEQVFLMFRILNINSYLALVPSPSQQIRPESEWPCLVCNFLSSSCSRQWVPITEYVLVLKHLFKEEQDTNVPPHAPRGTRSLRETGALISFIIVNGGEPENVQFLSAPLRLSRAVSVPRTAPSVSNWNNFRLRAKFVPYII